MPGPLGQVRAVVSALKFERNRGGLETSCLKQHESGKKSGPVDPKTPGPLVPNKSGPKGQDKSDSSDFFTIGRGGSALIIFL